MAEKVILERLRETASHMADSIGKAVGYKNFSDIMAVDTLNAIVLGFIFLAAFVVIASNVFYKKKKADEEDEKSNDKKTGAEKPRPAEEDRSHAGIGGAGPVQEVFSATKVSEIQCSSPAASHLIPGVAQAKGSDNDSVQWINSVLQWFYGPKGQACFHRIEDSWLTTLNAQSKKTSDESGLQLVFEKIENGSNIPKLDNVHVTDGMKNIATVNAGIKVINLSFGIQVSGCKGDKTWSRRHSVTVDSLTGQLKIACFAEELLFVVKFESLPNMKLSLSLRSDTDDTVQDEKEYQALELVISDTVTSAISSAIVDLTMGNCQDFPQFKRTKISVEPILPVGYDSLINSSPSGRANRKLLVKIIKGTNLGESIGCKQPYCIVEMDSPAQKYQTVNLIGPNPFWDEHFLFDLNDRQSELLFEIYDKGKPTGLSFLGLGIVNQEELLQAPSQRQIIPLQSRPLEHDKVSGSLTVEFLFMEGAEIPNLVALRSFASPPMMETHSRLTPGGTVITKTIKKTINDDDTGEVRVSSKIELTPEKMTVAVTDIDKVEPLPDLTHVLPSHVDDIRGDNASDSNSSVMDDIPEVDEPVDSQGSPVKNGVESLTAAALRELGEMGQSSPNSTTNKSTLIIHSVQRHGEKNANRGDGDKFGTLGSASSSSSKEGADGRSRTTDKPSFVKNLKKRLSFRKKRSKSMDIDGKRGGKQDDSSRSVSSDRSSPRSSGRPFLGIPGGSNNHNQEDSTRSSISELSGISSASTRTYVHEASTLVIETNENGIAKHYLISASLSKKRKWKKRGTKLHIYNDHVFIASHISGSTLCQVCTKLFPKRMGKQGYVCRDCQWTCHKPCHVKVEGHCQNSTVSTMEMEYVQDTKNKSKSS